MRFFLERVTDPDYEPVTLAEMRTHLKCIDGVTDDDTYITELISVAREWVETYTGKAFIDQTWCLSIDHDDYVPPGAAAAADTVSGPASWTRAGEIQLRRSPALAITSFVSVDSAGAETEVDGDTYEIRGANSKWPRVKALDGASWAAGSFRITFRAGYVDDMVPAVFKHAIKMIVSNFYENREPVNIGNVVAELPLSITWLLKPHRTSLGLA